MSRNFGTLLAVALLTSSAFSQTVTYQTPELKWRVAPAVSDYTSANYLQFVESYRKGVVQISDNEAIITMRYPKEKFGVARLDDKGNVKWETQIDGVIVATCKMGDRVVVLYTWDIEDLGLKEVVKKLNAATIDMNNGAILASKEILRNTSRRCIDVKVQVSTDEQVCHLLVRTTKYSGFGRRWSTDCAVSSGLQLYSVKKDLQVSAPLSIASKALNGNFLAAGKLTDGNLFLVSYKDRDLTVEKVDPASGSITSQFTTSSDFCDPSYPIYPFMQVDGNHLYLSLTYYRKKTGRVMGLYDVDWQAKTIKQQETVFNDEFGKSLFQQLGQTAANLKRSVDELKAWDFAVTADKIVTIMQAEHSTYSERSGATVYGFNDILVCVFNKQLQPTGNIIIGKSYRSYIQTGQQVGWHVDGSKMHLLFTKNGGRALTGVYARIDLDSHKLERNEPITQNNMRSDAHMQPQSVIWFKNAALLPYYLPRGTGSKGWVSQYQGMVIQ